MSSRLITHGEQHYRFLSGIDPYSCGVVALPGQEIIHVSVRSRMPWRDGLEWVDRLLKGENLSRTALCAVELRSPAPFTMEGFIEFNRGYCALLDSWGLRVGELNPLARTNVAPEALGLQTPWLHGFSFVRPRPGFDRRTFVVAGAGELREGTLDSRGIIRCGETSAEALREKAAYVLQVMDDRLRGLGADWTEVSTVNVYTVHPLDNGLRALLSARLGSAALRGITWHWARPPVEHIEFEMDLRGVAADWTL